MGQKYTGRRGNTTDAYRLVAGEVTSTGKLSHGREDLQQQVREIVAAAKKLKLTGKLAEFSHVTPERIERIRRKGKIPNNDYTLANIITAWADMKDRGVVPRKSSPSDHQRTAFDEMFNMAHT